MTSDKARLSAIGEQLAHFEVDFFLFLNSCDLARSQRGWIVICHVLIREAQDVVSKTA